MDKLSDQARKLKNEYQCQWRRKNPDKVNRYFVNYWENRAAAYSIDQKAKDLSKQGLTQRQIAEHLNISVGTVNKYLNK